MEIKGSNKNGYVEVIATEDNQQIGKTVSINVGKKALLEEFHVNRDKRGRGVGSSMMEETEKLAVEAGADQMLRIGLFCDSPSIEEYINTTNFLTRKRGFKNRLIFLEKKLTGDR